MFDIMTINANTALGEYSKALISDLNNIASLVGEKSCEYAVKIAIAYHSDAMRREIYATDSAFIPKKDKEFTKKLFAEYCEKYMGISKSNAYAYCQIGDVMQDYGHGYEFIWWHIAKEKYADDLKGIEGKFSQSAISVIVRLEDVIAIELMHQKVITPSTTVADLREIVPEYKGAILHNGEIIVATKTEKKPAKTEKKPVGGESAIESEKECVPVSADIADGITAHFAIPVDILAHFSDDATMIPFEVDGKSYSMPLTLMKFYLVKE